jgi:hypothetical protein
MSRECCPGRCCRMGYFASLVFAVAGYGAGIGREADVLNALREKDLAIRSAPFAVSFSMLGPAKLGDPNQGGVFMDCLAAQNEHGSLAMRITYYYEKDPVYVPPESRAYGAVDYRENKLIVWRKTEKYVLSSPERNTAIERLKLLLVDPNNRVTSVGENTLAYRLPIGSDDSSPEFRQFQVSTGWAYSRHLTRIVSTEQTDGLVKMSVEGSYSGADSGGVWDFSVDPNSGYVVRKASYHFKGVDRPSIIAANSGTLSSGNMTIARQGTCEFAMGLKLSVAVTEISREPSQISRLFDEVAAALDLPLPKGTMVLDSRGARPVRTTVEE